MPTAFSLLQWDMCIVYVNIFCSFTPPLIPHCEHQKAIAHSHAIENICTHAHTVYVHIDYEKQSFWFMAIKSFHCDVCSDGEHSIPHYLIGCLA